MASGRAVDEARGLAGQTPARDEPGRDEQVRDETVPPEASGFRTGRVSPEAWDAFVGSLPGDLLPQTTAWARTKRQIYDHEVLGVFDGSQLVGGCMLLRRRIGPVEIAYGPRGPLLAPGFDPAATQLVDAIVNAGRSRWPSGLILQPSAASASLGAALRRSGFSSSPVDVVPAATVQIDLDRGLDDILAAMRSSRRRNIRKAERAGVEVRRGDSSDLETFRQLHELTAARQGFVPMSADYLRTQWEILAPSGALRVYVADLAGEALSAATVSAFGDRMVFRLAGLSENPAARETRASDYLHWRVLCEAHAEGFGFYDLGGFDREAAEMIEQGGSPPDDIRASASQFKLGFGGDVVTLPRAVWRLGPGPVHLAQRPAGWLLQRVPFLQGVVARIRAG